MKKIYIFLLGFVLFFTSTISHAKDLEQRMESVECRVEIGNKTVFNINDLPVKTIKNSFDYVSNKKIYKTTVETIITYDNVTKEFRPALFEELTLRSDTQEKTDTAGLWRCTVAIEYALDSKNVEFIRTYGNWSEIGSSDLNIKNRSVHYTAQFKDSAPSDFKYPSSNTFNYYTYYGKKPVPYGGFMLSSAKCNIGADSVGYTSFVVTCLINL